MSGKRITIILLSIIAVAAITAVAIGLWIHLVPAPVDLATIVRSPQITGELSYEQVEEQRQPSEDLIQSLTANGNPLIYDAKHDIYYLSVAEGTIGQDTGIPFGAESADGSEVSMAFRDGIDRYSYFKPENNKSYFLHIYSDTEYQTAEIVITTMPFLSIETEECKSIGDSDLNCIITLQDGNWETHGTQPVTVSHAQIHIRGASSRIYPKKAYRINLKQDDYHTQNKVSLLGLRVDDDWILDAMYIDPTRMHNKLATEIWNEMSEGHYPTNNSPATKSEYVEVILNGEYIGLYDLLEPIDRKQLDVDTEKGLIIKTNSWEGTFFDNYEGYPNATEWMGFEVTYPKENVTAETWGDFFDIIQAAADSEENPGYFKRLATQMLDKENITDYWLWLTAFSLRDNRGKNLYWSTINIEDEAQKFYITPWDCDLAFGYRYGKNETTTLDVQHHRDHYENDYIDDFKLITKYLQMDVASSRALVIQKWETLTVEGGVLSQESVLERIRKTRAYLTETGAWKREMERWPDSMNPDPDEEFQYMENWLIGRYEWMETRLEEMMNGFKEK